VVFAELEKVNLTTVKNFLKKRKKERAPKEEIAVIENYINLNEAIKNILSLIKIEKARLEKLVIDLYPRLDKEEIKNLVIKEKWGTDLRKSFHFLNDHVSQQLTKRITELAARYESTLPQLELLASDYEARVKEHLKEMGFIWS
jgi:type I restriction enzyme M protein